MKINKKMILREVAGEYILVPVGTSVISTNGLFMLTETAAFIWKILSDAENEDYIVEKITEEYDVDAEEARTDVRNFLSFLHSHEIID